MQDSSVFANTRMQVLSSHCALVGLVARDIIERTYGPASHWGKAALVSGLFHDIGKLDPEFRRFLQLGEAAIVEDDGAHIAESKKTTGFSFDSYPRHNEISWMLLTTWIDDRAVEQSDILNGNLRLWECVKHVVFWHHAKPVRSEPAKFANRTQLYGLVETWAAHVAPDLESLIGEIFRKAGEPLERPLVAASPAHREEPTPGFKRTYASCTRDRLKVIVQEEAMYSAVRAAVVCADRMVSGLSAVELEESLARYHGTVSAEGRGQLPHVPLGHPAAAAQLCSQIDAMLQRYDEPPENSARNQAQRTAAHRLHRAQKAVLQGPAGCGKTKIILEYIRLQNGARTFIFVPRTAIGLGLFKELVDEYRVCASVELLTSDTREIANAQGEVSEVPEGQELGGQVVITTIDQLCNVVLGHRRIDVLTDVMNSTVVVDEFHELFDVSGVLLLFLELMVLRSKASSPAAKTLLVSATPNPFLVDLLSEIDSSSDAHFADNVVTVPTFNDKPIFLEFHSFVPQKDTPHPFEELRTPGDIAVSNTASLAQRAAISRIDENVPVLCYHSKFTPRDKKAVLDSVLCHFSRQSGSTEKLLFSGPIVQASLNITTRHLHTEACHAENWLQRLGRVNRFASFDSSRVTVYDHIVNGTPGHADKILSTLMQFRRAQAWLNYLRGHVRVEGPVTLQFLYEKYAEFHRLQSTREAYMADFEKVLEESRKTFARNTFDPVQYPAPAHGKPQRAKRLSARSLRGNSYFVLPIHYVLPRSGPAHQKWLFDENSPDADLLTDDLRRVLQNPARYESVVRYLASRDDVDCLHWTERLPGELRAAFSRRKPKFKGFEHWATFARNRNIPVLLSFPGWRTARMPYSYAYLTKHDVLIGLVADTVWTAPS